MHQLTLDLPPQTGDSIEYSGVKYRVLSTQDHHARDSKNNLKMSGFSILFKRDFDKQITTLEPVSFLALAGTPVLKPQNDGVTSAIGYPISTVTPPVALGYELGSKSRPLLVSFDSEWQELESKRDIISHQFSIKVGGEYFSWILLYKNNYRITHEKALSLFLEVTKELTGFDPNHQAKYHITMVAHFGVGDWSGFKNGKNVFKCSDSVRRTVVSIERPVKFNFIDGNRNVKRVIVSTIRDTYLLAPAGSQSLAALGKALGKLKVDLPDGYSKDLMRRFALERPHDFYVYGLMDTEIPIDWCAMITGDENMPVPTTLGSVGANTFKAEMCNLLGCTTAKFDLDWRGLETITTTEKMPDGRLRRNPKLIATPQFNIIENLATAAFMGGRNECFMVGIHHGDWHDFDLAGAYPTAMGLIEDPDYSDHASHLTGKLKRGFIHPTTWVFGYFKFSFPPEVMYPCLPVKDKEGRGLIFPRTGETYATGPELYLALELGADIEIVGTAYLQSTKPQKTMAAAMKGLIARRAVAVQTHGKGSPQELMAKEVACSVYGKLGQGLAGKTGYNPRTDKSKEIPPSSITAAPQAALITSLVRATVSAAMNQLHAQGYRIASVTTDGFLTDAPQSVMAGLDLYGLQGQLIFSRQQMAGTATIWELKHQAETLVMLKTRGGYGVSTRDEHKLPAASAGYRPSSQKILDDIANLGKAPAMAAEFLTRNGLLEFKFRKLTSIKQHIRTDTDGVADNISKTIGLEFDFKRAADTSTVTTNTVEIGGVEIEHVSYGTQPWESMQEFCDARAVMKDMQGLAIKTEDDLGEVLKRIGYKAQLRTGKVRVQENDLNRTLAVSVLRGLRSGALKCPAFDGMIGTAITMRVGDAYGVVLGSNDWKNAGRASRAAFVFDCNDPIALSLGITAV